MLFRENFIGKRYYIGGWSTIVKEQEYAFIYLDSFEVALLVII